MTYSGLADGSHTFNARAMDTLGDVTASTSYTWAVHLALPSIVIGYKSRPDSLYCHHCPAPGRSRGYRGSLWIAGVIGNHGE